MTGADVVGPAAPTHALVDPTLSEVVEVVDRFLDVTSLHPLTGPPGPGLAEVMTDDAAQQATTDDRAVVFDEGVPSAPRSRRSRRPSTFRRSPGRPTTSSWSWPAVVWEVRGAVGVRRTGELTLVPTAAGWRISAYDLVGDPHVTPVGRGPATCAGRPGAWPPSCLVALVAAAVVDLDRDIAAADLVLTAVQPGGSARYQPASPDTDLRVGGGFGRAPGPRGARGDALHVIGLNPGLGQATILNIPRDTYVDIPGHGRSRMNEAYQYGGAAAPGPDGAGLDRCTDQLRAHDDLHRPRGMVDALGGLEVDVPYPMHNPKAGTDFYPGRQSLGGAHVLAFARDRNSPAGDFNRTANQGQLIVHALESLRAKGPRGSTSSTTSTSCSATSAPRG